MSRTNNDFNNMVIKILCKVFGAKDITSIQFFHRAYLPNFLNCSMAVPRSTLDYSQGGSLTNSILITVFLQF